MSDVVRGKSSVFSLKWMPWYAFHGATAVLALWLVGKALAA